MYCPHCGKEIEEGATFCPNCGKQLGKAQQPDQLDEVDEFFKVSPPAQSTPAPAPTTQTPERNFLSLVGFILSFVIPLAGLICSSIAFSQAKKRQDAWKNFALAGIIIGAVSVVLGIIVDIFVYPMLQAMLEEMIGNMALL